MCLIFNRRYWGVFLWVINENYNASFVATFFYRFVSSFFSRDVALSVNSFMRSTNKPTTLNESKIN